MARSKRKFYLTRFVVSILSENRVPDDITPFEVGDQITNGDWSGVFRIEGDKELTPKQAAKALKNQGSDPAFFQLNDKGEDVE